MSNFPASLDDGTTLPNPTSGSFTNNPSHLGLHGNANDAIKAIEAKVGIGASTPPGSGYILTSSSTGGSTWQAPAPAGVWGAITGTLSNQTDLNTALNARVQLGGDISGTVTAPLVVTSNGIAIVTTTGTQTLTNKTLTSPVINTGTVGADPITNLGIASKQYVDNQGTVSLVENETPGGLINGSNTAYTTASSFATGSLRVYLNGQRLLAGGNDYTEGAQAFTMAYAPATGDVLLVDYNVTNSHFVQGSNSIIVQETPTGTVNGATTLFTVLQGKYVANTLEVFINGLQQTRTTDYLETSPGSGTFTFTTAPLTGDAVRVAYQFSTGASGNADTVDGIHANATATANQLYPLNASAKFPVDVLGIGSGAQTATVATAEATATTTYTNLATTGPAVTVTIGPSGIALVFLSLYAFNTTGAHTYMGYAVSGANTIAAADSNSIDIAGTQGVGTSNFYMLTGLTPGSTTFTAKYRVSAGTGTYQYRGITVIPL